MQVDTVFILLEPRQSRSGALQGRSSILIFQERCLEHEANSTYTERKDKGKMPVLHFGMTGMLQVKGQLATYYKETPKSASADWPPRFMKVHDCALEHHLSTYLRCLVYPSSGRRHRRDNPIGILGC
jgi:hypothetical protein